MLMTASATMMNFRGVVEGYWERGYRERTYLASKAIVVR